MREIVIRAWRCVRSELGGYYVYVDPRHETVKLFEGMDPMLSNLSGHSSPEEAEIYQQLELEMFRSKFDG